MFDTLIAFLATVTLPTSLFLPTDHFINKQAEITAVPLEKTGMTLILEV